MDRPRHQDVVVLDILDFQIHCSHPEIHGFYHRCLLTNHTKTMDENQDVSDDYKYKNEGLKDLGRKGRRCPEEAWSWTKNDPFPFNGKITVGRFGFSSGEFDWIMRDS